jgi:hypothetical protein
MMQENKAKSIMMIIVLYIDKCIYDISPVSHGGPIAIFFRYAYAAIALVFLISDRRAVSSCSKFLRRCDSPPMAGGRKIGVVPKPRL